MEAALTMELWADYFLLVEESLIEIRIFMVWEVNIPEKNKMFVMLPCSFGSGSQFLQFT